METQSRKSSRSVKIRRDPDFVYDSDIQFGNAARNSCIQSRNAHSSSESLSVFEEPSASNIGKDTPSSVSWSDAIDFNTVNDLGKISKRKFLMNIRFMCSLDQVKV